MQFEVCLHKQLNPWPVSVNSMYQLGGRRPRLTSSAVAWKATVRELAWLAWFQLGDAGRAAMEGAEVWTVELAWDFGPWHKSRPDLDNLTKLVADGIKQATGVDDRRFVPVARLAGPGPRASLTVAIRAGQGG